jgi:ATP-dependent Clp protease, protease subunit
MDYSLEKITNIDDRLYLSDLKERKIVLNDGVDYGLYEPIAMQIERFNAEDEKENIPVEERKPIKLYINSYGGIVYDGFGICSAIERSKTPVHAICDGYVMSMGFLIFAVSHKRFAGKFSNFMYHEISSGGVGKNTEIEEITKENKRLQKLYDTALLERTSLKKAQLDKVKRNKLDWFFGVEDAVKFGIVDEVL